MRKLLLLLPLLLLGAGDDDGSGEYAGWLPGTEPPGVTAVLVRDTETFRPIAGCRVRRSWEDASDTSILGSPAGFATTDEFGLAWLDTEEQGDTHWIFEKPGFAAKHVYVYERHPPKIVEMEPGRELHVRLFDASGQPVAGADVELFLGCSHSPTVRRAKTDARGRLKMADVDRGILWPVGDGLESDAIPIDLWYPLLPDGCNLGAPPVIRKDFHLSPGTTVRGLVLNEKGEPWPNATVRTFQSSGRGPRTLTDEAGRFTLVGVEAHERISVFAPGRVAKAFVDDYDPDHPLRIVLRTDLAYTEGRVDEDAEEVPLHVRVVDADTGELLKDIGVDLIRPADGMAFYASAPPGRYLLRTGWTTSSHVAPDRPLILTAGEMSTLVIKAHRQPKLVIDTAGLPEEEVELSVAVGGELFATELTVLHLPRTTPATLRIEAEGTTRYFPVDSEQNGIRRAKVDWPKMKRVRTELGGRYDIDLPDVWSRNIGKPVLETHASGPQRLLVSNDDLGYQVITVDIPDEPGAEVVVPTDALRPPGTLTVLGPKGHPGAEALIQTGPEQSGFYADEDGRAVSWLLHEGAHVTITAEGIDHPLRRRLAGTGPWTIKFGYSRIVVALRDQVPFRVLLDGFLHDSDGAELHLTGLAAGPHRLIVSPKGRRSRLYRVTLLAGETLPIVR